MIYSTSEIDTGKLWIDGKHIFKRVITYSQSTFPSDVVIDATLTSAYVDVLISMVGQFRQQNGNICGLSLADSSHNISAVFKANGMHIQQSGIDVTFAVVIVEYTKA